MSYYSTGAVSDVIGALRPTMSAPASATTGLSTAVLPNLTIRVHNADGTTTTVTLTPAQAVAAGYVWDTATKAWKKQASTSGTSVTVTTTEHTPAQQSCLKLVADQRTPCLQFLNMGGSIADFPSFYGCQQKGYAGDQLAICLAGRKQGRSYEEIAAAIAELQRQAAAQGAGGGLFGIPLWMLAAGGGALVLLLVLKKRKKKAP